MNKIAQGCCEDAWEVKQMWFKFRLLSILPDLPYVNAETKYFQHFYINVN